MENASKALIIAGAILLAILIIGLGVFIYNQASNTVSDTGMDQIAVRQFNAQFEPYIMENASGVTAMALYDTVQAYNATAPLGRKITMNLILREPLGKERFDLLRVTPQPGVPPDEAEAAAIEFKEGITFNKSELSATKRYNIRVMEYDGGTIKVINVYLAGNKIADDEIIKDRVFEKAK